MDATLQIAGKLTARITALYDHLDEYADEHGGLPAESHLDLAEVTARFMNLVYCRVDREEEVPPGALLHDLFTALSYFPQRASVQQALAIAPDVKEAKQMRVWLQEGTVPPPSAEEHHSSTETALKW